MEYRHVVATSAGNRELRGAPGSLPWGDSTPPSNGMLGNTSTGVTVNQTSVLNIAAVYGSVRVLTDAVATLPVRVLDSPALSTAKELAPSALVSQPFEEISRIDWWTQFVASLAIRGEFFGWIIQRDVDGYAQQIKPIPPDNVMVRRLTNGTIEYRFNNRVVPTLDVLHVKYQSLPGSLRGLSPIDCLAYAFGIALSQERYADSYYRNSANPSGVLQFEGDLDDSEVRAVLKKWLAGHQGLNKANLPAVLTDGAKWVPMSLSPEQSQLIQSRTFSQQQICGTVFGVPPHMVGLVDRTTSWGAGIEQQERGFVMNTLAGYIARGEESLTALHPPGQYVNFNLGHRIRGDTLQRAQAGSLMMLAGAWTANDVRAMFDMPPLPDDVGDQTYVPINTELYQMAQASIAASQQQQQVVQGQSGDQSQQNGHAPADVIQRVLARQ